MTVLSSGDAGQAWLMRESRWIRNTNRDKTLAPLSWRNDACASASNDDASLYPFTRSNLNDA